MNDRGGEQPLYINTEAMLTNQVSLTARGIAMSLVWLVWWPTKEPFLWDAKALSERIAAPGGDEDTVEAYKHEVATFFTILPDGRWCPSPDYFSLTDDEAANAN